MYMYISQEASCLACLQREAPVGFKALKPPPPEGVACFVTASFQQNKSLVVLKECLCVCLGKLFALIYLLLLG